jgi:hypothetical protein
MYNIPKITMVQIELTSRCNASCPACSRNISGGPLAPGVVPEDLMLEDIQRMFPLEIVKNLHLINYCGNLGDPGIAKDLFEVLDFFKQNASPKLIQIVRSNGGMRTPDYWSKLGKLFKKQFVPSHPFGQSGVVFSVDGLSDTNHIYRRGVVWDKLYENMKAYSDSGGYGIWEWLIFDHNKHQVDEARVLADKLGFEFVVKQPVGFGEIDGIKRPLRVLDKEGEYDYSIWPADFVGEKLEPEHPPKYVPGKWARPDLSDYSSQLGKESIIKCKSIQYEHHQEVFITASGHLLPCCYLGGAFGQRDTTYSRRQFNEKVDAVGLDKFDLRKHSMIDILQGPYFSKFFLDSWSAPSIEDGKMLFCVEICGEKSHIDKIYNAEFYEKAQNGILRKVVPIEKNS